MWSASLVLCLSLAQPGAGEEAKTLLRKAAQHLEYTLFDHCVVTLDLNCKDSFPDRVYRTETGTLIFGRMDDVIFCDCTTLPMLHIPKDDGYPNRTARTCDQIYLKKGRPALFVNYEVEKNKRELLVASVSPKEDDAQAEQRIQIYTHLLPLLGTFHPHPNRIAGLMNEATDVTGNASAATATIVSEYGRLVINAAMVNGLPYITTIVMSQSAEDRYHFRTDLRLRQIDRVWRSKVTGVTAHTFKITINAPQPTDSRPFESIVYDDDYTVDGKVWHSNETMKLTSYRRITSASEIEALRLPIPDGTRITSSDKDFNTVAMVYRNGEVIHEVDGRALQPGMAPPSRSIFSYLSYVLPATAVLAILVWLARRFLRPAATLGLLFVVMPVMAEQNPIPLRVTPIAAPSDRYCGLYCVYQAGLLCGKTLPLDGLFRNGRMTGKHGATLEDLEKICDEYTIPTATLNRVDYADLILLNRTVIALVKSSPDAQEPNHWVMLLGARPGWVNVYEPSLGQREVPEAELLAIWGGPVIVIAPDNDADAIRTRWSISKILFAAAFMGLIVLALSFWQRRFGRPAIGLVTVALLIAALQHLAHPGGFAHNASTLNLLARAKTPIDPPMVEPAELLGHENDYTIIDVRTTLQYDAERLPGAISLPIDAPFWRNREKLATLPADRKLLLYCNSSQCGWARQMASSALFHDRPSVAILHGGRDDYHASGGKLERGAPR